MLMCVDLWYMTMWPWYSRSKVQAQEYILEMITKSHIDTHRDLNEQFELWDWHYISWWCLKMATIWNFYSARESYFQFVHHVLPPGNANYENVVEYGYDMCPVKFMCFSCHCLSLITKINDICYSHQLTHGQSRVMRFQSSWDYIYWIANCCFCPVELYMHIKTWSVILFWRDGLCFIIMYCHLTFLVWNEDLKRSL